jgi:hypothetical protein
MFLRVGVGECAIIVLLVLVVVGIMLISIRSRRS